MAEKTLDESKVIPTKDIVANPDELRYLTQPCIMIMDTSMNMTFTTFVAAINILVEDDWRIDPPTLYGNYMMALCYNPRYKKKHVPVDLQRE